jgi:alkylhydroperoxidase/carboxymuconolactone decarboxylase family protein YurZ
MEPASTILSDEVLSILRRGYDARRMSAANVTAISAAYPGLRSWAAETSATFFDRQNAIAPRDRERCIVALLAYDGPPLSLAVHIYWGLMEGLSVDEVCETVALTGCYGGLPKCARGLLVLDRVVKLLRRLSEASPPPAEAVLDALVQEFRNST